MLPSERERASPQAGRDPVLKAASPAVLVPACCSSASPGLGVTPALSFAPQILV